MHELLDLRIQCMCSADNSFLSLALCKCNQEYTFGVIH